MRCEARTAKGSQCKMTKDLVYHRHSDGHEYLCCKRHHNWEFRPHKMTDNWTDTEIERREIVEAGGTVTAHLNRDTNLIVWAKEAGCYQRIDRRSKWGNPYKIPQDGDRDMVCDLYGEHIDKDPKSLDSLHGKVLACWCYPERCHGDELIKRINQDFGLTGDLPDLTEEQATLMIACGYARRIP